MQVRGQVEGFSQRPFGIGVLVQPCQCVAEAGERAQRRWLVVGDKGGVGRVGQRYLALPCVPADLELRAGQRRDLLVGQELEPAAQAYRAWDRDPGGKRPGVVTLWASYPGVVQQVGNLAVVFPHAVSMPEYPRTSPGLAGTVPARNTFPLTPGRYLGSGGSVGGRGMAVQDLLAIGASGFCGAVGVEGELPAFAVDADVMVELAYQSQVIQGGLAAVCFMAEVVDVAVHCRAATSRPRAFSVSEEDGAADLPRDAGAVADVEREARGVIRPVQQALAEDRGDTCRSRD